MIANDGGRRRTQPLDHCMFTGFLLSPRGRAAHNLSTTDSFSSCNNCRPVFEYRSRRSAISLLPSHLSSSFSAHTVPSANPPLNLSTILRSWLTSSRPSRDSIPISYEWLSIGTTYVYTNTTEISVKSRLLQPRSASAYPYFLLSCGWGLGVYSRGSTVICQLRRSQYQLFLSASPEPV